MFVKVILAITLMFFQSDLYADTTAYGPAGFETLNSSLAHENPKMVLADKEIVFVAGFLNEFIFSYFEDFERCLEKNWGVFDPILVRPSSNVPPWDASDWLREKLIRINQTSHKPLVIIAYSKGAIETLLTLLKYPELVTGGVVERFVAINGAFKGSHIADLIRGEGPISASKTHREFLKRNFPGLWYSGKKEIGNKVAEVMSQVNEDDLKAVSSILYYSRSRTSGMRTASYLLATNIYLQRNYGDNDGILLLDEQEPYGLGHDLGILNGVDHVDLVLTYPLSSMRATERYAFLDSLLKQIYRY
jgi:pimeloyl-ACP methyl ester carboxylesterase